MKARFQYSCIHVKNSEESVDLDKAVEEANKVGRTPNCF